MLYLLVNTFFYLYTITSIVQLMQDIPYLLDYAPHPKKRRTSENKNQISATPE